VLTSKSRQLAEAAAHIAGLEHRLASATAEVDRCRRDHTDLAQRNGALQATNVQLASRLERAELKAALAKHQTGGMSALVAVYRQQLLDHGLKPRALPATEQAS
jgi:regulator of replication initiation timing